MTAIVRSEDGKTLETEIRPDGLPDDIEGDIYGDEWPEDGVDVYEDDSGQQMIAVLEEGHGLDPGVYLITPVDTIFDGKEFVDEGEDGSEESADDSVEEVQG